MTDLGTFDFETDQATLLDGRITVTQPVKGYRISTDSVYLAAAIDIENGRRILDVGCGSGAIGLCLLKRYEEEDIALTNCDVQEMQCQLAQHNFSFNGFANIELKQVDILDCKSNGLTECGFDQVVTNPPYLDDGTAQLSPYENKKIANSGVSKSILSLWIKSCHYYLKNKGYLSLVQRMDRLDEILHYLHLYKFGDVRILPIYTKSDCPAKRVIISARKNVKTPMRMLPPLYVHNADGGYTDEAHHILYDVKSLPLWKD